MESGHLLTALSPSEINLLWIPLVCAVLGLLYAFYLMFQVLREPQGTPKMVEVAVAIQEGAMAYLSRQFRTIVWLVIGLCAVLYVTAPHENSIAIGRAIAFLFGCGFSGFTGFAGM